MRHPGQACTSERVYSHSWRVTPTAGARIRFGFHLAVPCQVASWEWGDGSRGHVRRGTLPAPRHEQGIGQQAPARTEGDPCLRLEGCVNAATEAAARSSASTSPPSAPATPSPCEPTSPALERSPAGSCALVRLSPTSSRKGCSKSGSQALTSPGPVASPEPLPTWSATDAEPSGSNGSGKPSKTPRNR